MAASTSAAARFPPLGRYQDQALPVAMALPEATRRYLVFHACDPADCRQYTNVQLNTLPLAVFLARILNRTLVLPPFMFFSTQGQSDLYRDGGHDQERALFRPFGAYFNVSQLQAATDVVDWPDFVASEGSVSIDHLYYLQHTHSLEKVSGGCPGLVRTLLGVEPNEVPQEDGSVVGRMLGERVGVRGFQCGSLDLNGPDGHERWLRTYLPPRASWLETQRVVGVLGAWWGRCATARNPMPAGAARPRERRQLSGTRAPPARSTNYADEAVSSQLLPPPVPSVVVDGALAFADDLLAEADAFIAARLGDAFVSVHWRHGDYIQWQKHAPPELVAAQALEALKNASVPAPSRRVFLATNCPDQQHLTVVQRLLAAGGAALVRFEADDVARRGGAENDAADMQLRLAFVEQLIAAVRAPRGTKPHARPHAYARGSARPSASRGVLHVSISVSICRR
jgi:hypothetical protein